MTTATLGQIPLGRVPLRVLQLTALAGLAAHALHATAGLGGQRLDTFFNDWLYNALVLGSALACLARAWLVRRERAPWLLVGAGLAAWSAGELDWTFVLADNAEPPYPSPADGLYLTFYPAMYGALVLLVRGRVREFHSSLWLDGAIGALLGAAIGAAIVFGPVMETTGGTTAAITTNLAYPLADLLLLAFVVGVFALTGWRPGRSWALLGVALATMALADWLFLYAAASGSYGAGDPLDTLWPAATLLIAAAAWQQPPPTVLRVHGWRMLVVPSAFALGALALLVYDRLNPVNDLAFALVVATLLAVVVRTAMTFGENLGMLERSRRQALTDTLTGLGNRRRLMLDLEEALWARRESPPRLLLLFDLNGFKRYNDAFGHPAGDVLLARLGRNLGTAIAPHGTAYRMGGDEFCALVRADVPSAVIVDAADHALAEHGDGFEISAAHGVVHLPAEAEDPALALQIADQRMYAAKDGLRASAGHQTRDVLLQVLSEREPDLREHLRGVARLATPVARRLGLVSERLDEVARAAELHDIGKMAIPDAILRSDVPLGEEEWRFVRQHTIVGERILAAAPALRPVAALVRSTHERHDGGGYPDGLAGEAIPLGARIIAVCDAFHAMTESRVYRGAMTPAEAIAELRAGAGSQFDPVVVEAFCAELAAGGFDGPSDPVTEPPVATTAANAGAPPPP